MKKLAARRHKSLENERVVDVIDDGVDAVSHGLMSAGRAIGIKPKRRSMLNTPLEQSGGAVVGQRDLDNVR